MNRLAIVILFALTWLGTMAQWDPDAGLVIPYSAKAKIIADGKNQSAAIDGKPQTKWEAKNPLPQHYISDARQNIFLKWANDLHISKDDARQAVDGELNNNVAIPEKSIRFTFAKPIDISLLSLKAKGKADIRLTIRDKNGNDLKTLSYKTDDSYKVKKYNISIHEAYSIQLNAEESFLLFEISALSGRPQSEFLIDLGRGRPVGWIDTRHFAGEHVQSIELLVSLNRNNWEKKGQLNPKALKRITTRFEEQNVRYIKLRYHYDFEDYAKAFLWEIAVYNSYGPFGPVPAFRPPRQPLKNTLGINTFWGWGHKKHVAELPPGKGPERFSSFMRHARYYHNLDWDVTDPDKIPDYSSMPGSLRQTWLDWDKEYEPVWDLGYSIQTTLQIPPAFKPEVWDNPEKAAYGYGKSFAGYFGNHQEYNVAAAEIGNEPWKYGADFYKKLLRGMSKGLKEGAPHMTVLPCALSANHQQPHLNNYIGEWLSHDATKYIDALNIHLYSYSTRDDGTTKAVHPEHPESEMRGILNMLRFRDINMTGKPVHITEWGWDAASKNAPCTHDECVSEEAQAAYAVRAMLWFYRLGVEKMFWYFFADEDKPSRRFTRSGLLSSPNNGLKSKKSWFALKNTIRTIGDKFLYDVSESMHGAWKYYFRNSAGTPTHLVVWIPAEYKATRNKPVTIDSPATIKKAFLPDANRQAVPYKKIDENLYRMKVGAYPVIIEFE